MRPDKLSLFDIFGRDRRYLVPLFQRQYVWVRDEQWGPLWEDIRGKALAVIEDVSRAPHFLGAMVLAQLPVHGKQVAADEIIDGQQRLTTMQLLLVAFRDVAHAKGEATYERDLRRQTANECVMDDPLVECFKVWPTAADQPHFTAAMTAGSKAALEHAYPAARIHGKGKQVSRRPRVVEAYCYFYDVVEKFLSDEQVASASAAHGKKPIDGLFETLRNYLHFVVITLEPGDDPQVIFETLNARGQPLLPSDLIRNFVFLRAKANYRAKANDSGTGDRGQEQLARLYDKYWKHYDERPDEGPDAGPLGFWKHEEKQGRLKRPRIDLFIYHYVQYRTERETNIGHLFQEFRRWWDSAPRDVEQELKDLRHYAEEFGRWIVPTGTTRLDLFAHRLNALDVGTVYPLLLYLAVDVRPMVDKQEFAGMLDDVESYLVRRTVCGLTTQNYNRFFLSVLRGLRASGSATRRSLQAQLGAGSGESVRWPDDTEFARNWLHRPVYDALGPAIVGFVLEAVEFSMRSNETELANMFRALTIEHVMPQGWRREEWPLAGGLDAEARRRRLLHSFGNLTLLTMPLNGRVRNRSFAAKREAINERTLLELNRRILEVPSWDEEAILERGKILFENARRLWPHLRAPERLDDRAWDPVDEFDVGEVEEHPMVVSMDRASELLAGFLRLRGAGAAQAAGMPVRRFEELLAEFGRLGGDKAAQASGEQGTMRREG
jgi:hypothetical protein